MAQLIKRFCQGVDFGGVVINERVEDQINDFLKENPSYNAKDINVVLGPSYKEAYVIFDVRIQDDRKQNYGANYSQKGK